MDDYAMELLKMIRENDEPERALIVAIEVITSYLKENRPLDFLEQSF